VSTPDLLVEPQLIPHSVVGQLTDEFMDVAMSQNSLGIDTFPALKPMFDSMPWLRRKANDWVRRITTESQRLYDGVAPSEVGAPPAVR
jgi:hypothetical protein